MTQHACNGIGKEPAIESLVLSPLSPLLVLWLGLCTTVCSVHHLSCKAAGNECSLTQHVFLVFHGGEHQPHCSQWVMLHDGAGPTLKCLVK